MKTLQLHTVQLVASSGAFVGSEQVHLQTNSYQTIVHFELP